MKDSKYLVCSAIPYLSGEPHIGTVMDGLFADCLKRFYSQLGNDVFFTNGTDEHGQKIHDKAIEVGLSPEDFTSQMAQNFISLFEKLDVNEDSFTRTSASESHKIAVEYAWRKLNENGFIYKGSYKGKYDVKEEEFISNEEARTIAEDDPERFERLQDVSEENYFFVLSKFQEILQEKIESDEIRIVPERAKKEALGWLNRGLEDISFTRPKSKVSWGITVPDDETQVIYVWLDALTNYLTAVGYPDEDGVHNRWPCDTQVVGKDILRFHAIYWPAILLALELPLYKELYVHGHISMDGRPMSKSLGNILKPMEIVDEYSSDVLRYYIFRHFPSHGDGDFSWEKLEAAYNGELANDLGNLIQRTFTLLEKCEGSFSFNEPTLLTGIEEHMNNYRFDKSLHEVFEVLKTLNKRLEDTQPWAVLKSDHDTAKGVLVEVAQEIYNIGYSLTSFMPDTSAKIQALFQSEKIRKPSQPLFPRKETK